MNRTQHPRRGAPQPARSATSAAVFAAGILGCLANTVSAAEIRIPSGAALNLNAGQAVLNCADLYVAGGFDVGTGQVGGARDVTIDGGTVSGTSGGYSVSGNWTNNGTFEPGSGSVEFTDGCRTTTTIAGNNTFHDVAFRSTAGKHFFLESGSVQTVNNALTTEGTPSDPVVLDNTGGTAAQFDVADGASVNRSNDSIVGGHVLLGPAAVPTLSFLSLMLLAGALGWAATRGRAAGLRA